MSIRNSAPLTFSPHGLSDAIDSTNTFEGSMQSLVNLIPDPATANTFQCRPAANLLSQFSGFSAPGFVSCTFVAGNYVYGMIASSRFAGHDEPFAFNLVTNTFTTITGSSAANTPASPASSGPWTPPTMSLQGGNLIITHPGYNFSGGFAYGVINITNPVSPTYTAGNLATNPLPALPVWVEVMNGRAWFLINNVPSANPGAFYTDILALTATNSNQIVTFDDDQQLTTAAPLGLFNQLGGIVQALMIFKNTVNIYQITGDPATNNLARNSLNVATGTNSANGVANTPQGLAFFAPDGLRMINQYGQVQDPIGVDGSGVNVPFIYNQQPSRAQAVSNQNVLRCTVQNANASGAFQEYWFDLSRQKWTGPHTCPASMISTFGNTFIMTFVGINAAIYQSDVVQGPTSTFVENGVPLTWTWGTSMLPDPKQMSYFAVVESTLNLQLVAQQPPVTVTAYDQNSLVLGQVQVTIAQLGTLWGQFNWGQANWAAGANALFPRPLEWPQPLQFRRMQIVASGTSINGLKIGDLFLRYQKLGYMIVDPANTIGTVLSDERTGFILIDPVTGAELTKQ